ncbi:MAG TPA: HAD hydrolase-like protein [Candidatus Limiplasma sp.]|nr:HAD hydrolase-like protein [Candidatus Limiplasma sp.]HPR79144.1 HAD hydrolase-like protein [Candidatus Limiplasma sp.]
MPHEEAMPETFDRTPRLILWDWNGTLLDDAAYAMGVRNRVFPRFGLPTIDSLEAYHEQFTFPVRLYYTRAGVTEENFVAVAHAWMEEYIRGCREVPLFPDAGEALDAFAAAGCAQAVLSASKLDTLTMQLECAGILNRFTGVLGLNHIYATSKEAIGRAYLEETGMEPGRCVMLGDTLHDAEVAAALGCPAVLIARGHQSRKTLLTAGVPVCESLSEAAELLLGRNHGHV